MQLSYRTVAMLATGRYVITGAQDVHEALKLANGIGIAVGRPDRCASAVLDWADGRHTDRQGDPVVTYHTRAKGKLCAEARCPVSGKLLSLSPYFGS